MSPAVRGAIPCEPPCALRSGHMLRATTTVTALALVGAVTAGCGGDASDRFGLGGDGDVPVDQAGEVDDLAAEPADIDTTPTAPDWDGPNELDLEFDELRAIVAEVFDENDTGRGSSNMWPAPMVEVEVRAGSMAEAEILAACEALTDWLFERPEEQAVGPVLVQISERGSGERLEDGELVAVNQDLIPREQRGACESV